MKRWVIDTNVPVAANEQGRGGEPPVTPKCRLDAIRFLERVRKNRESVILDESMNIDKEYQRRLNMKGQPGVGDRFYQWLWQNWTLHPRVPLPKRPDGEYLDLPQPIIDSGFDPDDRKFAALAKRENVPAVNAVDSDWLNWRPLLVAHGIRVKFVCGCDKTRWRQAAPNPAPRRARRPRRR